MSNEIVRVVVNRNALNLVESLDIEVLTEIARRLGVSIFVEKSKTLSSYEKSKTLSSYEKSKTLSS